MNTTNRDLPAQVHVTWHFPLGYHRDKRYTCDTKFSPFQYFPFGSAGVNISVERELLVFEVHETKHNKIITNRHIVFASISRAGVSFLIINSITLRWRLCFLTKLSMNNIKNKDRSPQFHFIRSLKFRIRVFHVVKKPGALTFGGAADQY